MSKIIKLQGATPTYEIKSSTPGGVVGFQVGGDAVIDGNLTVQGTTTTIESETLSVADNSILLNSNFLSGAPTEDSGIEVSRGDEPNVFLQWNETTDAWQLTDNTGTFYDIIHQGVTGSGSGLDADTLDGVDSTEFAIKDINEIVSGRWTFDASQGSTPLNSTYIELNGIDNSNINFENAGTLRMQASASATNFALRRHDVTGTFIESNLVVNLDSGVMTLASDDTIILDTPRLLGIADQDLTIIAGSNTVLNGDGYDLVLRPGVANGTGNEGKVVVGGSTPELTSLSSLALTATGDLSIQGLVYPSADGTSGQAILTDGAGNLTFGSIDLDGVLASDLQGPNEIIRMNAAGTAWEYVVDFQELSQDTTPQLGGNLDVNGNSIVGDIVLDPTTNIVVDGGIKATDDTALTIGAGNSTGTGADLILEPGTGTTADGNVVIGTPSSDTVIEAPSGNLIFDIQDGSSVIIGDSSSASPQLSPDTGVDLTVSGGDSIAPDTADGGDLILRGGISDLGTPGRVVIDSDVVFNGNAPTGTPYPINFFIHDLFTTGANANAVMSGHGVTDDATLSATGHVGQAFIASATTFSYIIRRLRGATSTDIGTIEFSAGNGIATNFTITDSTLLAGDVLLIVNPPTPDSNIDHITITLKSTTS
jgi:hypothetical protein